MNFNTSDSLHLTHRFVQAIDYARTLHVNYRKGTSIPYMAHLLGVASLVAGENGYVPFPVTEDMVIAALLHDAVEDEGGLLRLRHIEANFGEDVARMVMGCTDTAEDPKPAWRERKAMYVEHVATVDGQTRLISAADKLYNARAILADHRVMRGKIWARFERSREDQMWYFTRLVEIFRQAGTNRLIEEFARVVQELQQTED